MTETVYFRADTFRATIYLPRLHELTITNIRKLLRLVFCYDWCSAMTGRMRRPS